MKLLFDHNLSPSLVNSLAELYPNSNHPMFFSIKSNFFDIAVVVYPLSTMILQKNYCLTTIQYLLAIAGLILSAKWLYTFV